MREIKFRAWDVRRETMYVVDAITFRPNGDVYRITDRDDRQSFHIENPDDSILMQFTGLKDKNGREIYEGDVVRWRPTHRGAKGDENIDTVEWLGTGFMLVPWCHELDAADMEIIGNIHENPELVYDVVL